MVGNIPNIRAHVVVSGMVQGVFFRSYAREMAESLDITGWILNRWDGNVEAVFEGDKPSVEKMVDWCRKGPPSARVEDVEVSLEDYKGEFDRFSITY